MARGTITPWRSHQDLLQVRKQLYRLELAPDQPDCRRYAIQRVQAWKARGNLPHAVESTALLMDAILHHDNDSNSIFSIRAVYSAAFIRFVTGFCDIGRSKERLLEPSSMLEIAKQIDMPVEFVTLRHEATHQELPEIHRLVRATEDALDWLWTVYWSRLEEASLPAAAIVSAQEFKSEARQLLRGFRSARREALRAGRQHGHDADQNIRKTANVCAQLVGDDVAKLQGFANVLLHEKLLVPSNRDMGSPLDGAFLIWDLLLQHIFGEQAHFLKGLVNALLDSLDSPTTEDRDAEAYCLWLMHIVDHKAWNSVVPMEKEVIQRHITMWCCTHPGKWAKYLGTSIIAEDAELEQDWGALFETSQLGFENLESKLELQTEAGELRNNGDPCAVQDSATSDNNAVAAASSSRRVPEDAQAGWVRQAMRPTVAVGVCQ